MIKERKEEILWDTVTILKGQDRFENASALFKTLIERTFSTLRVSTKFLEDVKFDLPSDELISQIRILDNKIYQSLKNSNPTLAYESLVEYIERLSEAVPDTDRKKIFAKILSEQTKSYGKSSKPEINLAMPFTIELAEVYTSTEAAEIVGVTDQTIRRWCVNEKYPGAYQTEGRHWRIPKKYFKINFNEAKKRKAFERELDDFNLKIGEVNEDEFL